jgi:hypothetical protein
MARTHLRPCHLICAVQSPSLRDGIDGWRDALAGARDCRRTCPGIVRKGIPENQPLYSTVCAECNIFGVAYSEGSRDRPGREHSRRGPTLYTQGCYYPFGPNNIHPCGDYYCSRRREGPPGKGKGRPARGNGFPRATARIAPVAPTGANVRPSRPGRECYRGYVKLSVPFRIP